ncbi:MAG: hypothetical protein OHK0017_13630 [Patescibacteria group bacterium]
MPNFTITEKVENRSSELNESFEQIQKAKFLLNFLNLNELQDLLLLEDRRDKSALIRQIFRYIRDDLQRSNHLYEFISLCNYKDLNIFNIIAEIITEKQNKIKEGDYELYYNLDINPLDAEELRIWGAVRWCLVPKVDSPLFANMTVYEILNFLCEHADLQGVDFKNKELPLEPRQTSRGVEYLQYVLTSGQAETNRFYLNRFRKLFEQAKTKFEIGLSILHDIFPKEGDLNSDRKLWEVSFRDKLQKISKHNFELIIECFEPNQKSVKLTDLTSQNIMEIRTSGDRILNIKVDNLTESGGVIQTSTAQQILFVDALRPSATVIDDKIHSTFSLFETLSI